MVDGSDRSLEDRIARLERLVEGLVRDRSGAPGERASYRGRRAPDAGPRPEPERASEHHGPRAADPSSTDGQPGWQVPRPDPWTSLRGEQWMGRVGIAFVVLAFSFFLKLSVDRGWVTAPLRLTAGFGAALALLVVGLRVDSTRKRLGEVLLGGSIALFYLMSFAGYQLYGLLPFALSFSIMATTTVVAVALAEHRDSPVLAVIGVLGGLATPFLLERGDPDFVGLAIYTAAVLVGGAAVHYRRGWHTLLITLVLAGAVALIPLAIGGRAPGPTVLVAAVVVLYWLSSAASPLVRPILRPPAEPLAPPPLDDAPRWWGALDARGWSVGLLVLRIAVGLGTLVATVLLAVVLRTGETGSGLLLAASALALAVFSRVARPVRLSWQVAAEVSAIIGVAALLFLFQGPWALLTLAMLATLLFALAVRGAPVTLVLIGHTIMLGVAVAFVFQGTTSEPALIGPFRHGAVTRLGVVALVLVAAHALRPTEAIVYRGLAHLALMAWLLFELGPLESGVAWLSIAWGVQGAVVLLLSIHSGSDAMQKTGLATLALVALKMLFVDLAQLDAIWRILLFMGFGGALLLLSYLINAHDAGEEDVR